jgi:hypothetical protein
MSLGPAVATADLSPAAWQQVLQQGLPGYAEGRLVIEALVLSKQRRSASRQRHPHPLTLCVDLQVRDARTGQGGTQRLYGKAYRDGASTMAWQQACEQDWTTPAFGLALAHLPAQDMLWWAWPNDPGLPQLPRLLDATQPLAGQPLSSVQVLRYEPECRATLRATLADGRVIYGKTFADERGATVMTRFAHAWQAAQHDPLAPHVAEPLHHDAGTHTFWQAAASGAPLLELPEAERLPALHRLGQALARLQAWPTQPLAVDGERSIAHWLTEAARRAKKIGRAAPALAARAQALLHVLHDHTTSIDHLPLTLVHGDFHPDQVWVHEGRPLLFDFDEFTHGQPMEDLAAFITRLRQQPWPSAQCAAAEQALCCGYRETAPEHWALGALHWHLTLQALLQASRAFVFQVPGWAAAMDSRLAVAEACARVMTQALNSENRLP